MARKRTKGVKYNKITRQQKYIFLNGCVTEHKSISEAAYNAGIHYSTAKTILFFHKNHYKRYDDFALPIPKKKLVRASYQPLLEDFKSQNDRTQLIKIISRTTFTKSRRKKDKGVQEAVKENPVNSQMQKINMDNVKFEEDLNYPEDGVVHSPFQWAVFSPKEQENVKQELSE